MARGGLPPFLFEMGGDCPSQVEALARGLTPGVCCAMARAASQAARCPSLGPVAASLLKAEAALFFIAHDRMSADVGLPPMRR